MFSLATFCFLSPFQTVWPISVFLETPTPAYRSSVFALSPVSHASLLSVFISATARAHACAKTQGQDEERQYLKRRIWLWVDFERADFMALVGLEVAGAPGHSGAELVLEIL